jgi:hypothetical protein
MKYLVLIIALAMVAPVFAAGNLTVVGSSLAPGFIDTNVTTNMLNLTLNATVGTVNITAINVTIFGANSSEIYAVEVRSLAGTQAVSYALNTTTNKTTIALSTAISVNTSLNNSVLIAISLLPNATLRSAVAVNITSATEIGVDAGSNVTITLASLQSGDSQIQDVHANASVSPLYVDTNVVNQSFIYTILPTGRDRFRNISVVIPTQYAIVNVTEVKQGSSTVYNESVSTVSVFFNRTLGLVNITHNAEAGFDLTGTITINISVNTSSSYVAPMTFNSTVDGSNVTFVATTISGTNTTVTTQQILNMTSVSVSKGTALANGTDYWEFNLTLGFTANVSGVVQFKMANWSNSQSQTMYLTNGTVYYSTLRDSSNSSRVINVTTNYVSSQGISLQNCCTSSTVYTLILKMIIPSGTPSSAAWYTTYSMLFRSS